MRKIKPAKTFSGVAGGFSDYSIARKRCLSPSDYPLRMVLRIAYQTEYALDELFRDSI